MINNLACEIAGGSVTQVEEIYSASCYCEVVQAVCVSSGLRMNNFFMDDLPLLVSYPDGH